MAVTHFIPLSRTSSLCNKVIRNAVQRGLIRRRTFRSKLYKETCHREQESIDYTWKSVDLNRLSREEIKIHFRHKLACENGNNRYVDPATGYQVFTEYFHRKRGHCCGSACRHCPFNHKNVPEHQRTKTFNSAFYR